MELTRPVDLTDAEGFTASVAPHWPAMRRVAERLAGRANRDDVLQDALAAAWKHRGRFDPERGTLAAWLVTITANQARKSYRARRSVDALEDIAVEPVGRDLDLRRAIAKLPERQRLAIELFYFAGLPVVEVAAAMSCAEGTVKSTLAAARTALEKALREDEA